MADRKQNATAATTATHAHPSPEHPSPTSHPSHKKPPADAGPRRARGAQPPAAVPEGSNAVSQWREMQAERIPFSELLSEVIDNRGKTCPTAESGIPLIATNCIRNELLYPTYDKVRYVSQETYDTWFRGHPQPGDIIFVNKATPGRVCLVPDPIDFCIAQDMVAVRANDKKVYPKFLFALLRSPAVQAAIGQMHVGTLIPHFKKGDFDKLLLPIPEREAQEFIGDNYYMLSAKIELNRRMNETLEALAQSRFKSWFVDATQSALPKGWRETVLSECCENIFSGGTPSTQSPDYWGGDIPWLSSGETRGRFIIDTEKTITALGVENSSTRQARAGSTVIASAGQGHTRGQTSFLTFDSYINQSVVVLVADKKISSDLFLFFDLARPYEQFRAMSDSQSSRGSLTTKLLAEMKVVVPRRELISKFDEAVAPMTKKIIANLHESRTLAALRDALLPKLLSGELRVPAAAQLVEAMA